MSRDHGASGSGDLTRMVRNLVDKPTAPCFLTEAAERKPTQVQEYDYRFAVDVLAFRSFAQSGELYEILVKEVNRPEIDRDEIKIGLLRDVFAKRGSYRSPIEDAFARLFPSVLAYVRRVNTNDHATLVRVLQQEESSLVVETVAADLLSRHPGVFFLTLHDAIYATHGHLSKVQDSFGRAFDSRNFQLTYKTKLQEC